MKYRKDYVTNSSSSSFVCEICGEGQSGMDLSLRDAEMYMCVNGHVLCGSCMMELPRDYMVKYIKDALDEHTDEQLASMSYDELFDLFIDMDDAPYNIPEEACPVCQFIEYGEHDLAMFLKSEYHVDENEVFKIVKNANKKRKKLYDSEYISYVCKKQNINPSDVVASWKDRFATYKDFQKFIYK